MAYLLSGFSFGLHLDDGEHFGKTQAFNIFLLNNLDLITQKLKNPKAISGIGGFRVIK